MKVSAVKMTKTKGGMIHSNTFNTHRTRPQTAKTNFNFEEPLIDETIGPVGLDTTSGANLVDMIDREVELLKKESEEYAKGKKKTNNFEENTNLNTIVSPSGLGVYTGGVPNCKGKFSNKKEFLSLEELEKGKEEHRKTMMQLEKQLGEKRKKEEENINKLMKYYEDDEDMIQKLYGDVDREIQMEKEVHEKNSQSMTMAVSMHSKKINPDKMNKYKNKTLFVKTIKRAGMDLREQDSPLDTEQENYVKEYANYLVNKQFSVNKPEEDREKLWNKTGIKSQSIVAQRVVPYKPGDKSAKISQNYSMHYYSVGDNTPRSLSIESVSDSKSKSQLKETHPKPNNHISKEGKLSNSLKKSSLNLNSHLAFIKLVFSFLDKDKKGAVSKKEILEKLKLEENILKDLGFENEGDFQEGLKAFPSQMEDNMNEQETIAFLISRTELAEDYLENFRNHREETKMREENNYDFGVDMGEMDKYTEQNPLDNPSLKEYNRDLTINLRDKISQSNRNLNFKIEVKYKDYSDFLTKYQTQGSLNFTIPKDFEFTKRDYTQKKQAKIQEIIDERRRKEDEILAYRFKANYLNRDIFMGSLQNIIEVEKEKRKQRTEKIKEKIIQNMQPFSFCEQDERKYKEKLMKVSEPPQFVPFKATAIPWTSQVNMYDDIITKMEQERKRRVEERAIETKNSAKLPPRMEMHEKNRKLQEEQMKVTEKSGLKERSHSFKAKEIPDFAKAHETFINTLERKKSMAKPTEPVPFNFHEPKKKASLRGYLDQENNPEVKNPQFRRDISDVIQKIQQKPKIEPASTKALNLLMATVSILILNISIIFRGEKKLKKDNEKSTKNCLKIS